jgi:methanogenic corrinoid protein MtbC1
MRQQLATQDSWTELDGIRSSGGESPLSRPASPGYGAAAERRRTLTRTVEQQVIPRLLMQSRAAGLVAAPHVPLPILIPTETDVCALAELVLRSDQRATNSFIIDLRDKGAQPDALCLDLLAPTARRLGEFWEQDLCHFTEVTVGLVRLQHTLHTLAPLLPDPSQGSRVRPHALLIPVPGEQHSFGLAMVVEFFRRAGWSVWSGHVATRTELARMVADQSFGMVGLSAACGDDPEPVAKAVRQIRQASRNRDVAVMVGGPAFIADPLMAGLVGADATATDGRQAVLAAESLLAAKAGRPR